MHRLFAASLCPPLLLLLPFLFLLLTDPALSTPPWPNPYWDIPGDYCRAKYPSGRCCQGRQDPCSVPILGKAWQVMGVTRDWQTISID